VSPASLEDFLDTYRLRLVLDPMAARLSAPNLTDEELDVARDALDRLVRAMHANEWDEHRRSHREFHFALYAGCNSPWLIRILEMLWENSERYQRISAYRRGTPEERAREHEDILSAAKTRDGDQLAEAILLHISRTQAMIRQHFTDDNGGADPARVPVTTALS
jgi:DNA-binding GntR family transcriptional regulator